MEKKDIMKPKIGMNIYIPTSLYISHGQDDIAGGLATISDIEFNKTLPSDHYNYCMIEVKEIPNEGYNWNWLMENQEEWEKEYGVNIACPCPDYGGDQSGSI